MNIFGPEFTMIEKTLDVLTVRHTVIAGNVANVDTPNYKAKKLDFSTALDNALENSGISMKKSRDMHLSGAPVKGAITGLITEQINNSMRNDGNNVNIDSEMVTLSENSIMYEIAVQMLSRKFESLKYAISEGRRA